MIQDYKINCKLAVGLLNKMCQLFLGRVISVTDNIGRTVQSNTIGAAQGLNKTSVNVKSLAAGSYMVNVKTNEGSRTIKFIKD